jgi:parallel beta-helix repeat protein
MQKLRRMRVRLAVTAATGTVLAVTLSLGLAQASGVQLACGTTITTNTVLRSDITGCAGPGLIVGADNITLDLGGHTITGTGVDAGVRVDFHDGVTVRHGTVRGFAEGVVVNTAGGDNVLGMTVEGNVRGINLANASNTVIAGNLVRTSELDGIRVDGFGSTGDTVSNNVVLGSTYSITVSNAASGTTVSHNVMLNGKLYGLSIFSSPTGTTAVGNIANRNGIDGIYVDDSSTGTVLNRNVANANGQDGVRVLGPGAALTRNVANANGNLGIEAVAGVVDGGGNVARSNANPLQCTGVVCAPLPG